MGFQGKGRGLTSGCSRPRQGAAIVALIFSRSVLVEGAAEITQRQRQVDVQTRVKPQRIGYWLPRIQAHIEGHLARLRQVEKKKRST